MPSTPGGTATTHATQTGSCQSDTATTASATSSDDGSSTSTSTIPFASSYMTAWTTIGIGDLPAAALLIVRMAARRPAPRTVAREAVAR